jgi:hypothetical protein
MRTVVAVNSNWSSFSVTPSRLARYAFAVRENWVCGCGAVSAEYVGWDGVRDTGVNMLGRYRISHAARVAEVRGSRGYSLSHARRIDRKAVAASKRLFEQRPESVDETFLDITGRTVCHSSCRRNHDCH